MIDTVGWVYYKQDLPQLAIPQFQAAITKELAEIVGGAAAV